MPFRGLTLGICRFKPGRHDTLQGSYKSVVWKFCRRQGDGTGEEKAVPEVVVVDIAAGLPRKVKQKP